MCTAKSCMVNVRCPYKGKFWLPWVWLISEVKFTFALGTRTCLSRKVILRCEVHINLDLLLDKYPIHVEKLNVHQFLYHYRKGILLFLNGNEKIMPNTKVNFISLLFFRHSVLRTRKMTDKKYILKVLSQLSSM